MYIFFFHVTVDFRHFSEHLSHKIISFRIKLQHRAAYFFYEQAILWLIKKLNIEDDIPPVFLLLPY